MPIRVLPDLIANQIAAGEVIEGALSVVKELVENSIDAGATAIAISLAKQFRYIKVADNGSGIPADELSLAFTRHATSKICDIEDLYSIASNGFRGEALASIASVSKLTCVSRTRDADYATKFYIDAEKSSFSEVGAAIGTSIEVDDLFYNTPARLKFMKAAAKERQSVIDLVKGFILFNPDIAFTLIIDDKPLFSALNANSFKATVNELFGKSAFEHLIHFTYNTGTMKITAYISSPEFNRADKRYYFTAVNKRMVRCNTIRAAVDKVYKDLLPAKKYPIVIIHLEISSSEVDVNVHPRKQELKYANTNEVYRTLVTAISTNLSDYFYKCSEYRQLEVFNPQALISNLEIINSEEPAMIQPLLIPKTEFKEVTKNEAFDHRVLAKELKKTPTTFINRFPAIDLSLIEANLENYSEGLSINEETKSFTITALSESIGVLISGSLPFADVQIRDLYLDSIVTLAQNILSLKLEAEEMNESKNMGAELMSKKKAYSVNLSRPSIRPSLKQLEEIWLRDNYSCVYCAKPLIHPRLVKEAMSKSSLEFTSRLNSKNQRIDEHIIESHKASHDHHLPASKFAVLNLDTRNLFAVCRECNQKKSASLASKTWQPKRVNSWANISINNPLELAGVKFISAVEAVYDN